MFNGEHSLFCSAHLGPLPLRRFLKKKITAGQQRFIVIVQNSRGSGSHSESNHNQCQFYQAENKTRANQCNLILEPQSHAEFTG